MFGNVARAVLALRRRAGWTQAALGERAAVSRYIVSRVERSEFASMTLGHLDQIATALGASLHVQLRWRGEQLDRLIDAAHAAIQQSVAKMLTDLGWIVRVEVSFNHYGDRGRIDIIALHPRLRIVLVVEIKSGIGDLQDTLGRLDIKLRWAKAIAGDLGWTDVVACVPALVIGDTSAARRTVAAYPSLFAQFTRRGRQAIAWLRRPTDHAPTGLLWFTDRTELHQVRRIRR